MSWLTGALRVHSFGVIQIRISDPRSLRSWRVKGTEKSLPGVDSSVHSFDAPWSKWSWIIDPDLGHPKGTRPLIIQVIGSSAKRHWAYVTCLLYNVPERRFTRSALTIHSTIYLCGASFDVSSEISRWAASWNLPSSYILWNSRYFPAEKNYDQHDQIKKDLRKR